MAAWWCLLGIRGVDPGSNGPVRLWHFIHGGAVGMAGRGEGSGVQNQVGGRKKSKNRRKTKKEKNGITAGTGKWVPADPGASWKGREVTYWARW